METLKMILKNGPFVIFWKIVLGTKKNIHLLSDIFTEIKKNKKMKEQNFKNHSRIVPGFHGLAFLATISLLIGSFVNLFDSLNNKGNLYSASLICLIALILCLQFWYIRSFPLKAQDRAIRAEENFRHYLLTGQPFDSRLTLSQIIALRFAADSELPALAKKATDEGLSGADIKKSIQQWRADNHRV